MVFIPGMFDICKPKLDVQVGVTFSEWNYAIVLKGCAILWIVDWPTQGVAQGFAKYR